jgi:hypothetical protein
MSDNTLRFKLLNEKELVPQRDYINITTVDQPRPVVSKTNIQDVPLNLPLANNRRVPITYGNAPNDKPKAIPNPASPDGNKVTPGTIEAIHAGPGHPKFPNGAVEYIKEGGGGTVFEVPIYVPKEPGSKVKCQLKVYDLAGNLVISGESDKVKDGFVKGDQGAGEFVKLHLYWNGYNSKAMKVAPGTYRMVVYISYSGIKSDPLDKANAKNKKSQGLVGMSK